MNILFEVLRTLTYVYTRVLDVWQWYWETPNLDTPVRRYFLSDEHEFDDTYTMVPEDAVYIEEWVRNGEKKCRVLYEGEDIPQYWNGNPFDIPAKCPWIWVGDRETEIDLTKTFNKFLVVGNRIQLDLILKLIRVTEESDLVYIEAGTFDELKFPGDGILIETLDA